MMGVKDYAESVDSLGKISGILGFINGKFQMVQWNMSIIDLSVNLDGNICIMPHYNASQSWKF